MNAAEAVAALDDAANLEHLMGRLRKAGRVKTPKDAVDYSPPSFFRDLIFDPTMAMGRADLFLVAPDWLGRFERWSRVDPRIGFAFGDAPGVFMSSLTGPDAVVVCDGRLPKGTAISLTLDHLQLSPYGRKLVVLADASHAMIEGVNDAEDESARVAADRPRDGGDVPDRGRATQPRLALRGV